MKGESSKRDVLTGESFGVGEKPGAQEPTRMTELRLLAMVGRVPEPAIYSKYIGAFPNCY